MMIFFHSKKYSENDLCLLEEFHSRQAEEASQAALRTVMRRQMMTIRTQGGITLIHRYPLFGLTCKTVVQS